MSRGESQPAAVAGPGARTRRRGRVRRWGRRLALALLVLVIAVTLAAVVYDLASNGEMQPASSLYGGPFVRVDGTLLAYRKWGRGGSPVVLLGGAAEPSWVWHTVGPLLARADHRVFALDLPPFGYSQRRGPYTMAHWLQLLQRFERHFNLRRPVLVGHSLGAGVAAAAGLAHPSRVAGVVLLDGDALAFGGNHARLADLLVYPYYTALYRIVTGSDWIVGRALSNAWGPDPPRSTRQRSPSSNAPSGSREPTPRSSSSSQAASLGLTLTRLAHLRTPRAVIWGANDTVDSLASGRATAAALHTPFQPIPGAGHLSMLARPRAVANRILDFITTARHANSNVHH